MLKVVNQRRSVFVEVLKLFGVWDLSSKVVKNDFEFVRYQIRRKTSGLIVQKSVVKCNCWWC